MTALFDIALARDVVAAGRDCSRASRLTLTFKVFWPVFALGVLACPGPSAAAVTLSDMEQLGKHIYFDKNLSEPTGQACASCHDPRTGFTSPSALVNAFGAVERGAVIRRAGNRKPPSAAYATFSEDFSPNGGFNGAPEGGTFWDGRATGKIITDAIFPSSWSPEQRAAMTERLGPAADQAMGPFLNDVEQNLPSALELCQRVASAAYHPLWQSAWGDPIDCNAPDLSHQRIAFAVAVYEASPEVNSFSSKRDRALANESGEDPIEFPLAGLSAQENLGHDLFYTRANSCARFCHSNDPRAGATQDLDPTAGTDAEEIYTQTAAPFFNIGTPANAFNPWYRMVFQRDDDGDVINPAGLSWVDLGIAFRDDDGDSQSDFEGREGEFKVPTIRNVDKRPFPSFPKAYAHNGYFKSLKSIVHFYNTRDLKPTCRDRRGRPERFVPDAIAMLRGCWPLAEVQSTNIFQCNRDADCKVEIEGRTDAEVFANYCKQELFNVDGSDGGTEADSPRDIGNLCLTPAEEDAIVAYMKTLSDTLVVRPPSP